MLWTLGSFGESKLIMGVIMSYEMVVGLDIINDSDYQRYREAMTPILETFGGGFRYDFKVDEVLKNEEGRKINRVFTIHFKNKETMGQFFSDQKYLKVKAQFFETSVAGTTIISEYFR
jgi:uncharacterized protein (DUF1330 family)